MQRKHKAVIIVTSLFVVTSVGFNNCGQQGEIALYQNDLLSAETPDTPAENPPTDTTPKYVMKSTTVEVKNQNKVDVLIVVDNSGSMAAEQKNMGMRFGSFLSQLSGADWQVGIVTTDVSEDKETKDGRLVQINGADAGVRILDSSTPLTTAEGLFAATVQRSESGSGNEQGIKATYRFLERSLDGQGVNAANKALVRDNSALAVIVVTDANETTPSIENRNKPEELKKLVDEKFKNKPFAFHSIVVKDGDRTCLGKDGNEGFGLSYIAMSKLTNGIVGSVCESDYAGQLINMGKSVSELVNQVVLDCPPVDSNGDGKLDIEIKDSYNNEITDYTVTEKTVQLAQALPLGNTSVKYLCVAAE